MATSKQHIHVGQYTVEVYGSGTERNAAVDIGNAKFEGALIDRLLGVARDHGAKTLTVWQGGRGPFITDVDNG